MQPHDLITIRKALKMSRAAFSREVGLSARMTQYLEKGRFVIDKRTENSVRWVEHLNKWRKKHGEKDGQK